MNADRSPLTVEGVGVWRGETWECGRGVPCVKFAGVWDEQDEKWTEVEGIGRVASIR